MEYSDSLRLLETFINYERASKYLAKNENFGLSRMIQLLDILGNPQNNFVAFHIAGTKGKGSTAHLSAAILKRIGLKCGLFTSPHIIELRERIQIDSEYIEKDEFASCFELAYKASQLMAEENRPTYFEMLTAIAFLAFSRIPVDVAVLEVGLGGRLDSTNIPSLPVVVSAITPISYDHTALLGDTLEKIAYEKSCIIRRNTPVIVGRQEDRALAVIEEIIKNNNCVEVKVTEAVTAECIEYDFSRFMTQKIRIKTKRAVYDEIELPLIGDHQLDNAAAAVAMVEEFLETPIQPTIMKEAWTDLVVPGRVEIVSSVPWIVLDSSHNPASIWALSECIQKYFPSIYPKTLVFSANEDKDARAMLRILVPLFDSVVFTSNNSDRHTPPCRLAELALELYPNLTQDVKDNPLSAVDLALHISGNDGLVVVCGSMYLVGDTRDFCKTVGQFLDYEEGLEL